MTNTVVPLHDPPVRRPLTLRFGCPVEGLDGDLGVLGDVVVDPVGRVVTHVVVEPEHQHLQARLIPIDSVTSADDLMATVAVDRDVFGLLPRFTLSDFVPLGGRVDVGDDWEIASEHVVVLPYWSHVGGADLAPFERVADVSVDRVPVGDCEIRRESRVCDSDGRVLGHVDGLLVDAADVIGVVVRRRLGGLRHLITVPVSHVTSVTNETIVLDLDRNDLARLPRPPAELAPGRGSLPSPLEAHLSVVLHRVEAALRSAWDVLRRRG